MPEEVPEAASPLGQDPTPTPIEAVAPETVISPASTPSGEPAPVAPTAPTQINLTPEEHNALLEKANIYDTIAGDETASGLVRDHFQGRTGQAAPAPTEVPTGDDERYNALEAKYETGQKALMETVGRLQISEFQRTHPDLEDHRQHMGSLMTKNNMTMEEAYDVAKAMKVQQPPPSNQPGPAPVAAPTTEGRQAAPLPGEPVDALAAAEAKINDRSATPRIEDAFDLALKTAMAQHPDE